MPEKLRVFFGVPVDPGLQQQISGLLDVLPGSSRGVRWVAQQNRHMTLAFLGDQPLAVVESLERAMDTVYLRENAFRSVFTRLTRFPDPAGNIVALVCAADERLARLFRMTQSLLAQHGLVPEYETFRPHITLGRMRRGRSSLATIDQPTKLKLQVDRVTLYGSTLTRNGSVYETLAESVLGQNE
ncbi:MAG: RNA 2',3'-cyclic phosphodiesterase [Lysobacterales bacterium]